MYQKLEDINTRDFCLTCWQKDISQEEFKTWLMAHFEDKIDKYTIGNTELTEEEIPHFHVYIKFKNPIRGTTLAKRLNVPSIHIEKMKTNFVKCHNYCISEVGCFDSNVSEDIIVGAEKNQSDDAYESLIKDIFENHYSLYECCRKYGKIAILHFNGLKAVIDVRNKEESKLDYERMFDEEFDLIEN